MTPGAHHESPSPHRRRRSSWRRPSAESAASARRRTSLLHMPGPDHAVICLSCEAVCGAPKALAKPVQQSAELLVIMRQSLVPSRLPQKQALRLPLPACAVQGTRLPQGVCLPTSLPVQEFFRPAMLIDMRPPSSSTACRGRRLLASGERRRRRAANGQQPVGAAIFRCRVHLPARLSPWPRNV